MEHNKLIERFAEVQQMSYEEAEKLLGTGTDEELTEKIQDIITKQIYEKNNFVLNRKQRRALAKKSGNKALKYKNSDVLNEVSQTAQKLDYIDLIQKLRKLNEEKENEKNDTAN